MGDEKDRKIELREALADWAALQLEVKQLEVVAAMVRLADATLESTCIEIELNGWTALEPERPHDEDGDHEVHKPV